MNFVNVVLGQQTVDPEINASFFSKFLLLAELSDRTGWRMGIGHLEHGRHPAHGRGLRASLPIFLVGVARFTEVDMHVDDTGDQMQPCHIDHLCRFSQASRFADGANTTTCNSNIRQVTGRFIDDRAAS